MGSGFAANGRPFSGARQTKNPSILGVYKGDLCFEREIPMFNAEIYFATRALMQVHHNMCLKVIL